MFNELNINPGAIHLAPQTLNLSLKTINNHKLFFVMGVILLIGTGTYIYFNIGSMSNANSIIILSTSGFAVLIALCIGFYKSRQNSYQTFLKVWDQVGKENEKYLEVRNQLETWLLNDIPRNSKYTHIPENGVNSAKLLLFKYLNKILDYFNQGLLSSITKEVILQNLYDASKVCSPTWLEVARRECLRCQMSLSDKKNDFSDSDFAKDQILQYIQAIKEDLVLEYARINVPNAQWHAINYVRNKVGIEWGLDMSSNNFDTAAKTEDPGYTTEKIKEILGEQYTSDKLIACLLEKINYGAEHEGLSAFNPGIAKILESFVDKSKESFGLKEDDDIAMFILNQFFEKKKGNGEIYKINRNGAICILLELTILV